MIKKIAPDKWKHFYVGIAMGAVLLAAGDWLFPLHFRAVAIVVFILIAAICYGFELFSKFTGLGHYEVMDAVAGIVGGVLGMIVSAIFIWCCR